MLAARAAVLPVSTFRQHNQHASAPVRMLPHPSPADCSTSTWQNYDTAVDVAIRDASHKPNPSAQRAWPGDKQGYTQISHADAAEDYSRSGKQWNKHEATFTAPSDTVSRTLPAWAAFKAFGDGQQLSCKSPTPS